MYLPHSNPNLQYTPCRFDQLGYTLPYKVNVADFILDIASSDVYTEDRCVHGPRCSRTEPAVAMLSGSMPHAAPHCMRHLSTAPGIMVFVVPHIVAASKALCT